MVLYELKLDKDDLKMLVNTGFIIADVDNVGKIALLYRKA
jgi:hypothetical protein